MHASTRLIDMPEGDGGYRLAGNGVCCGVLRALGRTLKTYLNPQVAYPALSIESTHPPPSPVFARVLPSLKSDSSHAMQSRTGKLFEHELCLAVLRRKVSTWCGEQWWYLCRVRSLVKVVECMNVPCGLSKVLVSEGRARVRGWYYGTKQQLLSLGMGF